MSIRNVSFSHIAWKPEDENNMLAHLLGSGISRVEVAPLRTFGNPTLATERDVRVKADWYRERGFHIGSFQALLFGAEGVTLFAEEGARARMKEWLISVGRVAGWCGAGPLVFGSPKNRLKGELTCEHAMAVAVPFFREVGDACAEYGSCLVMEANPEAYGADFCTRMDQVMELVDAVGSPGFRLHVDAGGLGLSGEDFEPLLRQAGGLLAHVHASQPNLIDWNIPHEVHARLAAVLKDINYQGNIAIEMRMCEPITPSVTHAIEQVQLIYGMKS
jgi:D-psicose/D-tagatose/L-ribulose 3-epimerase